MAPKPSRHPLASPRHRLPAPADTSTNHRAASEPPMALADKRTRDRSIPSSARVSTDRRSGESRPGHYSGGPALLTRSRASKLAASSAGEAVAERRGPVGRTSSRDRREYRSSRTRAKLLEPGVGGVAGDGVGREEDGVSSVYSPSRMGDDSPDEGLTVEAYMARKRRGHVRGSELCSHRMRYPSLRSPLNAVRVCYYWT